MSLCSVSYTYKKILASEIMPVLILHIRPNEKNPETILWAMARLERRNWKNGEQEDHPGQAKKSSKETAKPRFGLISHPTDATKQ